MQVIDTSALLCVIFAEPDQDVFARALISTRGFISAATVHEAEVSILRRLGPDRVVEVRLLLDHAGARIVPFDDAQSRLAYDAYARFGKGRHPARLGLLDCTAYALAKSRNLPLLYKGNDFAQTDVVSAVIPG